MDCDPEKKTYRKHGGSRKMASWQEKLSACEPDAIRRFLPTATCACGDKCFDKVRGLENEGVMLIHKLRDDKCSGL